MNKKLYEPRNYKLSDMKEAVKERRKTKELAKDVYLKGGKTKELRNEIDLALQLAESMEIKHGKWLEEKIKNLTSYYSENALRSAFFEGLSTTITQENRLRGDISEMSSELENIIASYFFDFYRTLRICQNLGVNPNTGIEIAKKNYYHNPNILIELNKKYKNKVNRYVIEEKVSTNPKNAEKFIQRYIYLKDFLRREYEGNKDVTPGLIERAINFSVNNPKDWIERYLDEIKTLIPLYEDRVNKGVIKEICQKYPNDRENSIKRYIQEVERLTGLYPEEIVNKGVIERAVLNYSNPESFVKKFLQLIEKLKSKFPDINPSVIEKVIISYSNPETFLYYYKRKCEELSGKQEYEEITPSIIEFAVLKHSKPEDFLNYFIQKAEELKNNEKYKNLNTNVIETAVKGYSEPEIFLNKFIDIVNKLRREFGNLEGVTDSIIISIATTYQTNPENFLKKYLENRIKYLKYYKNFVPKINESVIEEFCFRNPKNPKDAIDKFIEQRQRLSNNERYRNLTQSVIEYACLDYPTNPENFLDTFILNFNRIKNDPEFGDLDNNVIERAALRTPKNPERFLRKYKIQVEYLSSKYPQVNQSIIKEAALNYSKDPEKYIIKYLSKK